MSLPEETKFLERPGSDQLPRLQPGPEGDGVPAITSDGAAEHHWWPHKGAISTTMTWNGSFTHLKRNLWVTHPEKSPFLFFSSDLFGNVSKQSGEKLVWFQELQLWVSNFIGWVTLCRLVLFFLCFLQALDTVGYVKNVIVSTFLSLFSLSLNLFAAALIWCSSFCPGQGGVGENQAP